jgi:hypothetical protein
MIALDRARSKSRWLADGADDESGMLSLVSLFVVLAFLALFAALSNIGKAVAQKLEAQNAADAVASSAGVELARGMNAITTTNHLIGELHALVVLHHALGGDELDGRANVAATPADIKNNLDTTFKIVVSATAGAAPVQAEYDDVAKEPQTGGALRDCRLRLKQVMTWAYASHAVGRFFLDMGWIPAVGPAIVATGDLIVFQSQGFEHKVWLEWKTLDSLETAARGLNPFKQALERTIVPGLHGYAQAQRVQAALKAESAADSIGQQHNVEGSLFPSVNKNPSSPALALPVQTEPAKLRFLARSQLVRASTPWIQYWRIPLLQLGDDALLLSRFKAAYFQRTDEFTLTLADRQKQERGVHLLIIQGLDQDGADKTNEVWTTADGSRDADRLFGTIGFARRPRPPLNAANLFRQGNPDGIVAYAQVMIYNANPQQRGTVAGTQPTAGWDTLGWITPVPEWSQTDTSGDPPIPNLAEPQQRIAWNSKLVPTTRLAESIFWQQGDLGKVLRRTPPFFTPLSGTH